MFAPLAGTKAMSFETLREECGIAVIYQLDQSKTAPLNVTRYIPGFLLDLQNRGQLSAGLTSFNPHRDRLLQTHKDIGTVEQVFRMYSPGNIEPCLKNSAAPLPSGMSVMRPVVRKTGILPNPLKGYTDANGNGSLWPSMATSPILRT